MSVRYPASDADGISSKTTGGAEMAVHMSMKRSGVSRSDVGLESSLMKRRSPPVGYSHDIGENVKLPLFSEGSELQKLDCDRQNNDIFNFKDCICESVTDLRSFYPLKNVTNVAIVGSLAYCSRVHLVKIFAQSDIRVVSNLTVANCVILGWWIEHDTFMSISAKNTYIITEEDILNVFPPEIKTNCRHLKFQTRRKVWEYDQCKNGMLFKDALRPNYIANIAGHQDAFNSIYTFIRRNVLGCISNNSSSLSTIIKDEKVCVLIYPPGCGLRIGVELICRALGLYCIYADLGSTSDRITANSNLMSINIFHMENIDASTLEQIVRENRSAIVLVEDCDKRFMAFRRSKPSTLLGSRGIMFSNVPGWIRSMAACITIPPTPDPACRTLVNYLIQDILGEALIPDVQVETFLEMGRTHNAYVDLERLVNNVNFYTGATKALSELYREDPLEVSESVNTGNALHGYDNSLEAVESEYQLISCAPVMPDYYSSCDIEIESVITDDVYTPEDGYYCFLSDTSFITLEMEKLYRSAKSLERQNRKEHVELMRLRRKLALVTCEPCEGYSAHNYCFPI
ncbi:hypothetical protein X943_001754 [Babesia divergens]|uniref:Uncharacterized protein n=1 Tax=Babesia divergens TaxID=32595 RepID=A0AAD9LHW5_BABDI|nr:hypothetical protein X943_001754 [Babesia divergens]